MDVLKYIFKRSHKILSYGGISRRGRNFYGKICVFHRGGGLRSRMRLVDIYRRYNSYGLVFKNCYDSKRTGIISMLLFLNGFFAFVLLTEGVSVGNTIYLGASTDKMGLGWSVPLQNFSIFSVISNFELQPKGGGLISRAAGTGAIIIARELDHYLIKVRSGWLLTVSSDCLATLGYVSNGGHELEILEKAGRNRRLGIRPCVRGVVMNPCDHPHGGGNGKTSPPSVPKTPWGKATKGVHTKKKKIDKLRRKLFKQIR